MNAVPSFLTAAFADADRLAPGEIEPGVIDPGRALALVDFSPPTTSLAERLIRMAYRAGVPAPMLTRAMGRRSRPRLLATVTNPLPGDAARGTALRAGHFTVHGARTRIDHVDFAGTARLAPPVERLVHGFGWLADLEACCPREQGAPAAERILAAWLAANPSPPSRPGKGPAWSVGVAAARLLHWLIHAPLVLSGEKALRSRTLAAMSATARWLDRHADKAEDGVSHVAGWCAVIAAGLLLPDGRPRRLLGEAGLARALGELVGDDGGVLSRSPVAQMEALALLVKLRACYQATRRDMPAGYESVVSLLTPPLLAMQHSDGGLGSWHGGWAVSAAQVAALVRASGVRTRALREVGQWGYQRATAQKAVLLFDAAPPPVPRHARHACASTLAFELSHGPFRLVVNCGGAESAGSAVPARLEQGLRATAAHSTLTLDETNSTAILLNGAIGPGVSEVGFDRRMVETEEGAPAMRLEASHDGYAARFGLTHRRVLVLRDDGLELYGEDLLLPAARKAKRGKLAYAIRFHLGPEVEVVSAGSVDGASLALPDGSLWHFLASEGELAVEESLWVDGEGRPQPTRCLVLSGMVSRGGGNFVWLLRKLA